VRSRNCCSALAACTASDLWGMDIAQESCHRGYVDGDEKNGGNGELRKQKVAMGKSLE